MKARSVLHSSLVQVMPSTSVFLARGRYYQISAPANKMCPQSDLMIKCSMKYLLMYSDGDQGRGKPHQTVPYSMMMSLVASLCSRTLKPATEAPFCWQKLSMIRKAFFAGCGKYHLWSAGSLSIWEKISGLYVVPS